MKIISEFISGSRSYGLNVPGSDFDVRFCFLNDDPARILGTQRFEHQDNINNTEDRFGFELVNYLKLLKKANTVAYEMLFNDKWIIKEYQFDLIQSNRARLMDSGNLFKCLRGYALSEKGQIFGRNTGKLGAKRKESLEKYNYSFRNAVHALRLLRVGHFFFTEGYYPVNIVSADKEYGQMILDLKTNPQNYRPDELELLIDKLNADLLKSFDGRNFNYEFDEKLTNELILEIYLPILNNTERNYV